MERIVTRRAFRISFLLLLGLLVGFFGARTSAQADASSTELAVVVNPQNPVNGLTLAELRRIYMGDQRYWSSKLQIQLLVRAPGPERDLILKVIYQLNESQYKQYWITKIFRGEASAEPVAVFSNGAAAEGVRGIPGAVACVDPHSVGSGLKVLKIDGKLPGEPGYPLRNH
jgi:ABC-type phosphate transport system substrate-binding protein